MPETNQRRRNWAPWVGLLLALAAVLANAGFFLHVPGEKAIPLICLALAMAALVYAVVGVMRAFRQPQVYGGKVSSSILGVLSLIICALVGVGYVQSRSLPASTQAPQVGQKAPDFTLADTSGAKVSLGQLLGRADGSALSVAAHPAGGSPTKAVLLIFYRGYW